MRHRLLTALALTIATALFVAPGPHADALAGTAPPVITVDVRASDGQGAWVGWYKDTVSAVLRATDDDGIARLAYRLTGAETGEGNISGALLPVTISAEGLTTIEITATDTAGNTSTRSYGVGIDRTKPTTTRNLFPGVPRNENRTVDYSCADPGGPTSAIVSCTATHDDIPFTSGTRIDTSQPGPHVFVITATDRVSNVTQDVLRYEATRYTLISPPRIEGDPTSIKVGQPLRASGGALDPTPGQFFYQWRIDGRVVSQLNPFIPRAEHLGKRISLSVFASDAGPNFGNQTNTAPVGDVLVKDDLRVVRHPIIDHNPATARPGDVLRATDAEFTPSPSSVTYRWYAGDQQVGTGQTYTVQPTDVGKTLAMDAFAIAPNPSYLDTASARHGAVQVKPHIFQTQKSPAVTGTADVGGTLTITNGTVTPTTPPASSHWTLDGTVAATGNPLTLTRAHAGRVVACYQVFKAPGYAELTVPCVFSGGATSITVPGTRIVDTGGPGTAWTITVPAGIKGKAKVGKRLRAVLPQLSTPAATYRYQWLRNNKPIKKATKAGYKVRKTDRKRKLTVRITATSPTGAVLVSTATAIRVNR